MKEDRRIWQEFKEIKDSLRHISEDVGTIKVEIGKHHEKFKYLFEKANDLDCRVIDLDKDLEDTKKEVRGFRVWVLSGVIAGLLSLIGFMIGIARWMTERM